MPDEWLVTNTEGCLRESQSPSSLTLSITTGLSLTISPKHLKTLILN